MKENEKNYKYIKATATYKSGREEAVRGDLNKDQIPPVAFQRRIAALRSFPTVVRVQIIKY